MSTLPYMKGAQSTWVAHPFHVSSRVQDTIAHVMRVCVQIFMFHYESNIFALNNGSHPDFALAARGQETTP